MGKELLSERVPSILMASLQMLWPYDVPTIPNRVAYKTTNYIKRKNTVPLAFLTASSLLIKASYTSYNFQLITSKESTVYAMTNSINTWKEIEKLEKTKNQKDWHYSRRWGELLGYPDCCIEAFINDLKKKNNPIKRYISQCKKEGLTYECRKHGTETLLGGFNLSRKNDGQQRHYESKDPIIQYIPCSPFCKKTTLIYGLSSMRLRRYFSDLSENEPSFINLNLNFHKHR